MHELGSWEEGCVGRVYYRWLYLIGRVALSLSRRGRGKGLLDWEKERKPGNSWQVVAVMDLVAGATPNAAASNDDGNEDEDGGDVGGDARRARLLNDDDALDAVVVVVGARAILVRVLDMYMIYSVGRFCVADIGLGR